MEIIRIRPRFKKLVPQTISEITSKVKEQLLEETNVTGKVNYNFITLKVPEEERHFWTPQLSINLEEEEEGNGTVLHGLYGPRPDIWMLYMFLYFISGLLTLIFLIIGLSQRNLGLTSYILWFIPFTIGGGLVLWFTSKTGQKLASNQMVQIHGFVEKHLFEDSKDHLD